METNILFEKFPLQIRDERQFKALTGTTPDQFERLEAEFSKVYRDERRSAHENAVGEGTRKRKPGGGRKGILSQVHLKVFFLLYYLKTYPTFDSLGSVFRMSRSKACENVHGLMPILSKTLQNPNYMPHGKFETLEQFEEAFKNIDVLMADATERPVQRPADDEKQAEHYSGKRKDHTVKNTILATKDKIVSFVGKTFCGSRHDFSIFQDDFPPETEWFRDIALYVDMGYTGIRNIYVGKNINVPYRRPRKSEKNPTRKMDMSQTNYNRAMAKIRIFVENSIAGLKRYRIMAHDFRNRKEGFIDDTIANCAGLWNMMLGVAV